MISKLFGSKARVSILKAFLLHPGEKFYIRQLARNLKLQLNSVRRELENLEKFGLLESKTGHDKEEKDETAEKGKNKESGQEKKYYKLNTDFVLYEEIKALIVKSQILYERDFVDKLRKVGKPKLLVFTGFFVNNPFSPVDLLVVGQLNRNKLLKVIRDLESDLGREINFTIMSNREFKYRRDMTDVFLYDILEGKKMVVVNEFDAS